MDLFRRFFSQSGSEEEDTASKNEKSESLPEQTQTATDQTILNESITQEIPMAEQVETGISDGATRPLPLESVISTHNEHLSFGQSTDVGMVRNNNQDSAFSFFSTSRSVEDQPDFGLFIVADGMGGHQLGEKASATAARIVASYITGKIYLPMVSSDGENGDRPPIVETLISAVQQANAEVLAQIPEGGTTLTAAAIISDLAYVVHVGDSRIYLVTKDGTEQVTRDHSLVQRLIELHQLTPEEAQDHPQKNVLYRALGQNEGLEIDALTRRLPPNSRLLICSDGLWNQVSDKEIGEITMSHENPQEACDKLVALANTRGGTDNITAILLKIPSS
ncbi:MAG: protein phosphatase 2C domain-containing protein [Anaerolineae bacterium]|nr:protein phosphatase 2C domain-containing protein [Anaerolineae bacterium]